MRQTTGNQCATSTPLVGQHRLRRLAGDDLPQPDYGGLLSWNNAAALYVEIRIRSPVPTCVLANGCQAKGDRLATDKFEKDDKPKGDEHVGRWVGVYGCMAVWLYGCLFVSVCVRVCVYVCICMCVCVYSCNVA